jgi:hypothetical protein
MSEYNDLFEEGGFAYTPPSKRKTLATINKYDKERKKVAVLSKFKNKNLVNEYIIGREALETEHNPEEFSSKSKKRREEKYKEINQ